MLLYNSTDYHQVVYHTFGFHWIRKVTLDSRITSELPDFAGLPTQKNVTELNEHVVQILQYQYANDFMSVRARCVRYNIQKQNKNKKLIVYIIGDFTFYLPTFKTVGSLVNSLGLFLHVIFCFMFL